MTKNPAQKKSQKSHYLTQPRIIWVGTKPLCYWVSCHQTGLCRAVACRLESPFNIWLVLVHWKLVSYQSASWNSVCMMGVLHRPNTDLPDPFVSCKTKKSFILTYMHISKQDINSCVCLHAMSSMAVSWVWKWTTARNLETGKTADSGIHVLLICATTQQWNHKNFPWLKSMLTKEHTRWIGTATVTS